MIEQFFSTYGLTKYFGIVGLQLSVWLVFFYYYLGQKEFVRILNYKDCKSKNEKYGSVYLNLMSFGAIVCLWSMLVCGILGV
jgi:ABC-type sugar transport system permease subunit